MGHAWAPSHLTHDRLLLFCVVAIMATMASAEVTPLWEQYAADYDRMLPEEMELEQVESPDKPGSITESEKPFPFDPVADRFAGKAAGIPTQDRMANPVNTLPFPKYHKAANPCYQHVGHSFEWSTTKLGESVGGTGTWKKTGNIGASLKTTASL